MSMDYEMNQEPKSSRSYIVTLLLNFFLGWLGVHRFYTGYVWIGVVQLLTLGGGLGLWVLIDAISLIMNKYRDADGNKLEGYNVGCAVIVAVFLVLTFVWSGISGVLAVFAGK